MYKMANAYQVKADVINELRNKLYYNQLEIQRLLNAPGKSHKEVVDTVIYYLKENVEAQSSIELIDAYLPAQPQQAPQPNTSPAPAVTEASDDGVKKID
jgi:hypothetical protein